MLCSIASRFQYRVKDRGSRNFHYNLCRQLKGGGMEILMKNELTKVDYNESNGKLVESFSNELANRVIAVLNTPEGNEKAKELLIRANVNSVELFKSYMDASVQISKAQLNFLKEIYIAATQKKLAEEMKGLDSFDKIIEQYNQKIDRVLDQLDLNNTENTLNAIAYTKELRSSLQEQLGKSQNHSPFKRLFQKLTQKK